MSPSGSPFRDGWAGTTCLVTGGLGFVGSNLVHALVAAGVSVRIVDGLIPDHGGRIENVDGLKVETLVALIDDPRVLDLLDGVDVVFNVAGQVSHTASMRDPQRDLHLNATSHASFLGMLRVANPTARVVYASTRQVYGRPTMATVDESHAANPVDVNGVAKLAGEQLHLVHSRAYGMPISALRLTNVYGPRQRLTSDELGFLPVFIRRALLGEQIPIYGDGTQRRDCLHVDDVVAALEAAAGDAAVGQVFNVGHPTTHELREIADLIVDAAGSDSSVHLVPWPGDHARIDIGSFHTGSSKIHEVLGWQASMPLDQGLRLTAGFYREHPWYLSSS
jgi:UDP-glucose 4-epimerase